MSKHNQKKQVHSERRAFIKTTVLCSGAAILCGVPLATYFISPALKKGAGKWVDFGAVADLTPDSIEMLTYEFMIKDGWQVLPQRGFVWAKFDSDRNIKIFSSTCTHLACNVIWREEVNAFECPCHSGRFDDDGRPIAGPPTKPLAVLAHKVEDDNLMVHMTLN